MIKRSIMVGGHKTSVSLEDAFFIAFKEIADSRHMTLLELASSSAGREYEPVVGDPPVRCSMAADRDRYQSPRQYPRSVAGAPSRHHQRALRSATRRRLGVAVMAHDGAG